MQCKKVEIFLPEDWRRVESMRGLKQYSSETNLYLCAFSQYKDLFRDYPRVFLFIGENHVLEQLRDLDKSGSRMVEVLHNIDSPDLLFAEFTPVGDEETLKRIVDYHYWRDKDSKPIRYCVGDGLPMGVLPMNFSKSRVLEEAPNRRIILAVNTDLTDRLVIPHLRDALGYREIQKYIVK